jgi:sec-independent protein translocase protein TatA
MVPLFAMLTPTTALVVGVVVLLLFGNRLPSVMRSLGQGMNEFKKGLEEGGKAASETKQVEDTSTTKVG